MQSSVCEGSAEVRYQQSVVGRSCEKVGFETLYPQKMRLA